MPTNQSSGAPAAFCAVTVNWPLTANWVKNAAMVIPGAASANSWLSNFGQLRRNTDRFTDQRLGQVALALILTVKLVKWASRWTD